MQTLPPQMILTLPKTPPLQKPRVHSLCNGLTIIAEQMPIEAVSLNVWINVGSAVESDSINGMAHFLEHIIFKGTENLASGEFERRVEERGAIANAATSQDYTQFYITSAPKDFKDLVPLQIDLVCNPSIPPDGFETERLVVLEEIRRSQDSIGRRISRRLMETAFDFLPYRRPILGLESIISQLTPQQMGEFHDTWYQPSSLTAVAVGNLPVDQLIEIVAEGFEEKMARSSKYLARPPLEVIDNQEPAFTGITRHEFTDENLQEARLIVLWRVPGLGEIKNTYALDVLAGILGQGRSSRLVQDLREERGLVSTISVSNSNYKLQGLFTISAKCNVEDLAAVETGIVEHLEKLQTELVKESEILRIQTRVANRFIFNNETPGDRSGLYGYYQCLVGDLDPAFNYPQHIQMQNEYDLMKAAQKYLSPQDYRAVIIKPR